MTARPDIQFRQSVQRAAQRALRDSWKERLPTATASFDPQYIAPAGLFQPSRTWRFTVTLSQPVFEGGERRAAARLREVAVNQARLSLESNAIQARSEVRLATESLTILELDAQRSARDADTAATVAEDAVRRARLDLLVATGRFPR